VTAAEIRVTLLVFAAVVAALEEDLRRSGSSGEGRRVDGSCC